MKIPIIGSKTRDSWVIVIAATVNVTGQSDIAIDDIVFRCYFWYTCGLDVKGQCVLILTPRIRDSYYYYSYSS